MLSLLEMTVCSERLVRSNPPKLQALCGKKTNKKNRIYISSDVGEVGGFLVVYSGFLEDASSHHWSQVTTCHGGQIQTFYQNHDRFVEINN